MTLSFRESSDDEFWTLIDAPMKGIFSSRVESRPQDLLNESEKQSLRDLRGLMKDQFRLRLLAFVDGALAGWHFGWQTDGETYYMTNSAVLPEFRNRGVYAALLKETIERVRDRGFQMLSSRHHGNNPEVLIPKLRQGFIVTGSQLDERFGFLIEMRLYLNAERRRRYDERMGLRRG